MKTIFSVAVLVLSMGAFAGTKSYVSCSVGVTGNNYIPLDFVFENITSVTAYLSSADIQIKLSNF